MDIAQVYATEIVGFIIIGIIFDHLDALETIIDFFHHPALRLANTADKTPVKVVIINDQHPKIFWGFCHQSHFPFLF